MREKHQIKVGERTAEQIKIQVGAVYADLDDAPADFTVWGANMMDTMPRKVEVNYREIAECLDNSIGKIESAILRTLEATPPELYADIVANGVVLTGGGALLRGLDKRLSKRFGLDFKIAENPLHSVSSRYGHRAEEHPQLNFLFR